MSSLSKYYRKPKLYINLPSKLNFYKDMITEDEKSTYNEIGVMAMTTMNELMLKNPEALLNGEAIRHLIQDCTTLKIDPRKLIKADVDALLLGIKRASTGRTQEFETKCPNEKCGHESIHERDLDALLETIKHHDSEYSLHLEDINLTLFLRPSLFEEVMQLEHEAFNEKKKASSLEKKLKDMLASNTELTEEEEYDFLGKMNTMLRDMTIATVDLYAKNITKIYQVDEDEYVSDKEEIKNWLMQTDTDTFDKIKNKITEINQVGLDDTEKLKCPECDHTWDQRFDINITDFFANGS